MPQDNDKLNCIKNLVQIMCCDDKIEKEELRFLSKAAKELSVQIDDWKGLLKQVQADNLDFYPIRDRDKAIATLKALVVMAKVDRETAKEEKRMIRDFARSINVDDDQWKRILSEIDTENLFAVFNKIRGSIIAVEDDFEKIQAFCTAAEANNVTVTAVGMKTILEDKNICRGKIVCFHVAEKRENSIAKCRQLMEITEGKLVGIFTRFQGMQVQYLRELGLKKCIIEPVYSQDIINIFKP